MPDMEGLLREHKTRVDKSLVDAEKFFPRSSKNADDTEPHALPINLRTIRTRYSDGSATAGRPHFKDEQTP
jgi:hypothetical protein